MAQDYLAAQYSRDESRDFCVAILAEQEHFVHSFSTQRIRSIIREEHPDARVFIDTFFSYSSDNLELQSCAHSIVDKEKYKIILAVGKAATAAAQCVVQMRDPHIQVLFVGDFSPRLERGVDLSEHVQMFYPGVIVDSEEVLRH